MTRPMEPNMLRIFKSQNSHLVLVDMLDGIALPTPAIWYDLLNPSPEETRLVEGQYPDYAQIIPKESKTEAVIELGPLVKAVRTASLFVRSGINDVTLSLEPDKKRVSLSSANAESGEHRGSVAAKIDGPATSIVFNFRYLLDGLSVINAESVKLGVSDSGSPGILRAQDAGTDYLYLIMPIRQ